MATFLRPVFVAALTLCSMTSEAAAPQAPAMSAAVVRQPAPVEQTLRLHLAAEMRATLRAATPEIVLPAIDLKVPSLTRDRVESGDQPT